MQLNSFDPIIETIKSAEETIQIDNGVESYKNLPRRERKHYKVIHSHGQFVKPNSAMPSRRNQNNTFKLGQNL